MRVLVIGGSGFVGGLVLPVLSQAHSLRVFDLKPPGDPALEFIEGSVADPQALASASENMDALLYMAMGPHRDGFDVGLAFDVNVKGVYLALDAARHAGIPHAVYTSSMSVYRDLGSRYVSSEDAPPDAGEVYGFTKRLGEEVCRNAAREWGMSVTALRLCLPTADDRWLAQSRAGVATIRTAASDLARALLAALDYRSGFQAFMISGDYEQKTMNMEKAERLLGWTPLARPVQ